jgi:putative iron-only hydrogenase system regulator
LYIEAKDTVFSWRGLAAAQILAASFGVRSFFMCRKERTMETRVAVIGIIVENPDSVERVNDILHRHASYILGRMGIPYREKGVSIISIALDAPQDVINSLSGAIGKLPGVSAKTAYSNLISKT